MSERGEAIREMVAAMRRKGMAVTDEQAEEMAREAELVPVAGQVSPEGYAELVEALRKM